MNDKERDIESDAREAPTAEEALRELVLVLPRVAKGLRRQHAETIPGELQAVFQKGFSGRHLLALSHLAQAEPLSVGELGERLNVSLPTVSVVVHQLAEYGLVERQEDPSDRRRAIVRIDPVHRPWVDASLQNAAAPLRRALERLRPAERGIFLRALNLLADELKDNQRPDDGQDERFLDGRPCD